MKKLILILSIVFGVYASSFAQTKFQRLEPEEIASCSTAESVAYNFVYDIIFQDYKGALALLTPEAISSLGGSWETYEYLKDEKYSDIIPMRSVMRLGYYPVITFVDKLNTSDYFDDGKDPYKGMNALNVRIDCVNAKGEFFNEYYNENEDGWAPINTNVRVMMVELPEKGWMVMGFK